MMNDRTGLAGLLVVVLASSGCDREPAADGGARAAGEPREAYDLLIHDGTVLDGTGAPGRTAAVLLREGLVAYVGEVDPDTVDVSATFDARGLVVAPGFIDPHAHGDPTDTSGFTNFLAMGITTVVLGQDGSSPAARSLAAHLEAVDAARPALNVAYLIGHNTIRGESGVGLGEPGPDGLARMAGLVGRALDAGAFGLSTGLEYTPGDLSEVDELAAIAAPVAERDGVVMSHLRSEDADQIEVSVAELLEQGRRSGGRVHVSHLKIVLGSDSAAAGRVLTMMEQARLDGLRVTADVYPYLASFTGIGILFPDWARGAADYESVVRERRAELEAHLRERVGSRNGPEATLFGSGPWPGRTLAEAAELEDRPFEELLVDLGPGGASAAYFVMDERVMTRFLADPHVAISTDGSPTMAHPRGYGAFARVIRRYVTETGLLTLEEAVRKMTSLPASILGLDDAERVAVRRGLLRAGWAGDVVAFDPAAVRDRASFESPHVLAEGMHAVWVGGQLAWSNGGPAEGAGNGRVVRGR